MRICISAFYCYNGFISTKVGVYMARSENQKLKTLYVAKYFMENSDENHSVAAADIIDYLEEECGITADRRSIYRDIAALRDVFGMDIEGS